MDISRALRLLRIFHNLTQAELAEKIGMSKSYISEIEAGAKRVNVEILEKYAHVFDMPASQIVLFSESLDNDSMSEKVRVALSKKFLTLLEWVAHQHDRKKT